VQLLLGTTVLAGSLVVPDDVVAIAVLPHASSHRHATHRSRHLASALHERGIATLSVDLLAEEEEGIDATLASRLVDVTDWLGSRPRVAGLPVAYLAVETAAAAIEAAAARPRVVRAVVACGGHPERAGTALRELRAATLFLVAATDPLAIARDRRALCRTLAPAWIERVPGIAHLLDDVGGLDEVATRAASWIAEHARAADRAA
jgi:putative phosphoribosyl transferase